MRTNKKTVSRFRHSIPHSPALRALEAAECGDFEAHVKVLEFYARSHLPRRILDQLEGLVVHSIFQLTLSVSGLRVLGYGGAKGRPLKKNPRKSQLIGWASDLLEEQRTGGLGEKSRSHLERYLLAVMKTPEKFNKLRSALSGRDRGRPPKYDPFTSNIDLYFAVEEARSGRKLEKTARGEVAARLGISDFTVRNRYLDFEKSSEFLFVQSQLSEKQ